MSKASFGPGALYVRRTDTANQPTVNIGYAQELTINEQGDLVENYGTSQYAIDQARGTIKATGKIKTARVSGIAINSVFHGEVLTAGSLGATAFPGEVATLPAATVINASAATAADGDTVTFAAAPNVVPGQVATHANIPAGTAVQSVAGDVVTLTQAVTGTGIAVNDPVTFGPVNTVANGAEFNQDLGIVYNLTGLPLLTAGSGTPAGAGQYSVNGATGEYFFHPSDAGKQIATMYAYTQPAGQTKIVLNHQLGYTPTFQLDYVTVFEGALSYVRIFKCVATKFDRQFKLKAFLAPEIDFGISANAANQIYQETYPEVS
ncbi:MAG: hypothetical protein M0006_03315 [Magnetospirillum sp.]|nr:hypothetical protein [Magnetospirillum sp.]